MPDNDTNRTTIEELAEENVFLCNELDWWRGFARILLVCVILLSVLIYVQRSM